MKFRYLICTLILFLIPIFSALADDKSKAPDATLPGPHLVATGEYRLPAAVDPDVLPSVMTEIWAKVFYPIDINTQDNKLPLILMMHGNHETCEYDNLDGGCEYTTSGTCPVGSHPSLSHEGYNYLAKNLASWGYLVVSINTNRGINCENGDKDDLGLIAARGRLALQHLSLLHKWETDGNAPTSIGVGVQGLKDKIDFSNVGLFGHSRGGQGVRAAYNLYKDANSSWPAKIPGLKIKALFEIGATDFPNPRVWDANGIIWNQLVPMCDGDVVNLEGRFPFERMMLNVSENPDAQKSLYQVWGANHNFFNTEWKQSDAQSCATFQIFDPRTIGSEKQQKIALASVSAFFRSHLRQNPEYAFNKNFNPSFSLPDTVTDVTQVDQDFTPSPKASEYITVEDFDKEDGKNSSGFINEGKSRIEAHLFLDLKKIYTKQRYGAISWFQASKYTSFDAVWADQLQGRDIRDFKMLDFRVGRADSSLNSTPSTDFGIALVDASGHQSNEIYVSNYAVINGPASYYTGGYNDPQDPPRFNITFKTVRIPLSVFKEVDFSKIHSFRFIFDRTEKGALNFANIRLHKQLGLGSDPQPSSKSLSLNSKLYNSTIKKKASDRIVVPEALNSIQSIKMVKPTDGIRIAVLKQQMIEIKLASQVPFTVMDRLPVLQIGKQEFNISHYQNLSNLKEITFTLSQEQYQKISANDSICVFNGKVWKFGTLTKWQQQHAFSPEVNK